MEIATWNVNSLNVRLPQLLEYLGQYRPDIVALQETKLPDEKFPRVEIERAGYRVLFAGQNSYNGMAIASRQPIVDPVADIPGFGDPQRRLLAVTVNDTRIINVYVPNGQEVGSEKYAYKFRWLDAFRNYLQDEMARHERLIVLGDFNIAPAAIDTHDAQRWDGRIMCSDDERAFFRSLLALGLDDTVRRLHPEEGMFSWWDYRLAAFRRGWGLRIDHVLASDTLDAAAADVDLEFRARERPSDHAPVRVKFA